jgi:hypothetical protein
MQLNIHDGEDKEGRGCAYQEAEIADIDTMGSN